MKHRRHCRRLQLPIAEVTAKCDMHSARAQTHDRLTDIVLYCMKLLKYVQCNWFFALRRPLLCMEQKHGRNAVEASNHCVASRYRDWCRIESKADLPARMSSGEASRMQAWAPRSACPASTFCTFSPSGRSSGKGYLPLYGA